MKTNRSFQQQEKRWSTVKLFFHHVQPGVSHHTNDNYCVNAPPYRLLVRGQEPVKCKKLCQPQWTVPDHSKNRETVNLYYCHQAGSVSGETVNVCQTTKCPKCCTKSACRGLTKSVLGNLGSLGGWTLGDTNIERGLPSPFPDQTKLDKVTNNHQLLCTSSQEPLPVRGIVSADKQRCSRAGLKSNLFFFTTGYFLVP